MLKLEHRGHELYNKPVAQRISGGTLPGYPVSALPASGGRGGYQLQKMARPVLPRQVPRRQKF